MFGASNMLRDELMKQLKLCLVTNVEGDLTSYAEMIQRAALGGITMVQLREKHDDINHVREKAVFLKNILRPFGIPLIINDHVELAAEIDAAGVHIGPQDMPVEVARSILGKNKIIGLSIESLHQLYAANNQPDISYVTASAVFPSVTKIDCKTIWGINNLKKLVTESSHIITAIGGINSTNVLKVFNAGVCGVAVVSAIQNAPDPYQAAKELALLINSRGN